MSNECSSGVPDGVGKRHGRGTEEVQKSGEGVYLIRVGKQNIRHFAERGGISDVQHILNSLIS